MVTIEKLEKKIAETLDENAYEGISICSRMIVKKKHECNKDRRIFVTFCLYVCNLESVPGMAAASSWTGVDWVIVKLVTLVQCMDISGCARSHRGLLSNNWT